MSCACESELHRPASAADRVRGHVRGPVLAVAPATSLLTSCLADETLCAALPSTARV